MQAAAVEGRDDTHISIRPQLGLETHTVTRTHAYRNGKQENLNGNGRIEIALT